MDEVIFGLLGSVDSGKSTLLGLLTKNKLDKIELYDDGAGSLRNKVLRFDHERKNGQTSSINLLHNERYSFVDLAGHQKYLKTTIKGVTKYNIDYCFILISASKGITNMTKEHIAIAKMLNKPIIILVTKIDIAPLNVYKNTIKNIKSIIKKSSFKQKVLIDFSLKENIDKFIKKFTVKNTSVCPILKISNKTGENIESLVYLISKLKSRQKFINSEDKCRFKIYEKYDVKGIGKVFFGRVLEGNIKVGDKLCIGPLNKEWYNLVVKSIHCKDENLINELKTGEFGCIAVNITKNIKIKSCKSLIIKSLNKKIKVSNKYRAKVFISGNNKTTFCVGYEPYINSSSCSQVGKITAIKDAKYLRAGDMAEIEFEFKNRAEFMKKGDIFIFREQNTKGVGKIKEVLVN